MFCNNKEMLSRLIVENPAAVKGEDWQAHLRECTECRREWEAYAKSLAIFLQLEKERDAQFTFRLSWEDLSHSVNRRGSWVRRMGLGRGMLAASAGTPAVPSPPMLCEVSTRSSEPLLMTRSFSDKIGRVSSVKLPLTWNNVPMITSPLR